MMTNTISYYRREGLTVEQAQELAMEMLMKGLDEQETGEEQNG